MPCYLPVQTWGEDRDLREIAWWVFPGGADAARGALTTIASVTISTVGVVFSITMVVLQLASSQFTPRVLGSFLSNRIVQVTFGMFIATFVFSLTVLRSVLSEDEEGNGFVPVANVEGRAWAIFYPFSHFGTLGHTDAFAALEEN